MKTARLFAPPNRNLKMMLASIAIALLVAVGLLLASVLLTPLDTPAHSLQAPPAAASQGTSSIGVNGTLASFTALIPEMFGAYLPLVAH